MSPAPGGEPGDGPAVDLVVSGSDGAPGRWRWPALRRVRPAGLPRWARVVAAVLGIAAVLVTLRLTSRAPDDRPRPAPSGQAGVVLPSPPFDRLPGRTPIPEPTRTGWALRGRLPPVGGPDKAAAVRAAQLVIGRYCAEPAAYTLTAAPERDWRRVSVLVFSLDRSGDPPRIGLGLRWTGSTYDWVGTPVQLAGC